MDASHSRRDSRFHLVFKGFDDYSTDPRQLETLAEEVLRVFFADREHFAAGGVIVHQIGPSSGTTTSFSCGTASSTDEARPETLHAAIRRFTDSFPKQPQQDIVPSSSGGETVLTVVPILLSPDVPAGFYWAVSAASQARPVLVALSDAAAMMSVLLSSAKTRYALREASSSALLDGASPKGELASHIAELCLRALPCDTVAIWEVDTEQQVLRTTATASHSGQRFALDMPLGKGAIAECVARKTIFVVQDLLDHDHLHNLGIEPFRHEPLVRKTGWRSAILLPLRVGESVLGVLAVYALGRAAFSTLDIEIATLLAEKICAVFSHRQKTDELEEIQRRFITELPAVDFGLLAMERVHDVANYLAAAQSRISGIRSQLLALKRTSLVSETEAASETVDAAYRLLRQIVRARTLQPRQFVRVELRSVLQALAAAAENKADAARVEVVLKCPLGLYVLGDPHGLQLAFGNLLDNSVYWLERDAKGGRKRVCITVKRSAANAIVSVWDNGPGIDPQGIVRLFDYFYTTKGERGFGLGLPSAKRIVEAHGGTITCSSKWGFETEFQVQLPLVLSKGRNGGRSTQTQ